jgi:hypothetical protein
VQDVGVDPVSQEPLSEDDLLEIKSNKVRLDTYDPQVRREGSQAMRCAADSENLPSSWVWTFDRV